ncbi:hypothetical protein KEM48_003886 [Puccinia striiformis f. sp. tritici PST-130]|nr:hypothetical protein KEM48_003886 [Puccinia striiformis f. sp. tritici PST-130]
MVFAWPNAHEMHVSGSSSTNDIEAYDDLAVGHVMIPAYLLFPSASPVMQSSTVAFLAAVSGLAAVNAGTFDCSPYQNRYVGQCFYMTGSRWLSTYLLDLITLYINPVTRTAWFITSALTPVVAVTRIITAKPFTRLITISIVIPPPIWSQTETPRKALRISG